VLPGLAVVTRGVIGVAEAVEGASLLMLVAGFRRQAERGFVQCAGIVALAGCEEDFTEPVERVGFTVLVTDLAELAQAALEIVPGLLAVAQSQGGQAEPGQPCSGACAATATRLARSASSQPRAAGGSVTGGTGVAGRGMRGRRWRSAGCSVSTATAAVCT
jgi:hypothetical protein